MQQGHDQSTRDASLADFGVVQDHDHSDDEGPGEGDDHGQELDRDSDAEDWATTDRTPVPDPHDHSDGVPDYYVEATPASERPEAPPWASPDRPDEWRVSGPDCCDECGSQRLGGIVSDPFVDDPCEGETLKSCECCRCPACGSKSIYFRASKTPDYRCINCEHEFDRPVESDDPADLLTERECFACGAVTSWVSVRTIAEWRESPPGARFERREALREREATRSGEDDGPVWR